MISVTFHMFPLQSAIALRGDALAAALRCRFVTCEQADNRLHGHNFDNSSRCQIEFRPLRADTRSPDG